MHERGAQIVSASADGVRRWTARDGQETGGAEARSDGAVAVRSSGVERRPAVAADRVEVQCGALQRLLDERRAIV